MVAGTVDSTTDLMRSLRGERWFAPSFTIAGDEAPACEWLEAHNEAWNGHRGKPVDGKVGRRCRRRVLDALEPRPQPTGERGPAPCEARVRGLSEIVVGWMHWSTEAKRMRHAPGNADRVVFHENHAHTRSRTVGVRVAKRVG